MSMYIVWAGEFDRRLEAEGLSDNTRRAYVSDLEGYLEWTGDYGHISPETVPDYLNWLRKNKVSNATLNRKATTLRKYFDDHPDAGILRKYKAPPVPAGKAHPLPNLMDDVRAMIATSCGQHRVAIALCGFAGLRINEARELAIGDIDFVGKELTIRGKGQKVRYVPMAPELELILTEYLNASSIIPWEPGMPLIDISDRGIRGAITRAGQRANIDRPVCSHDLRMTFGSVVYDKTKDLRVTQELLGHSSSTTTERYTGISEATKVAAVKAAMT